MEQPAALGGCESRHVERDDPQPPRPVARQARQTIYSCVSGDKKFDEQDVNHILAYKRQTLGSDGLLEYVESPVSISEVGGLEQLKVWLNQRQDAVAMRPSSSESIRLEVC